MIRKRATYVLIALFILSCLIHFFSANKNFAETNYAGTVYPVISFFLKSLLGWIPFSVGDVLYGLAGGWMICKICNGAVILLKRKTTVQQVLQQVKKTTIVLLLIYILFNLLWGINYNRKGIAYQLGLEPAKYNVTQLRAIDSLVLQKVNSSKNALNAAGKSYTGKAGLFKEAANSYNQLTAVSFFKPYKPSSVKNSMWGWLGNYLGFTGYYNPFTGEAQVNTTVPSFLHPFITCHEIAHQQGYAKEDEANFVGYLAAASSKDAAFNYSAYLEIFLYTNRNLYRYDSSCARQFARQLLPAVQADILQWKKFNEQHVNPVEPAISWLYGKFLQGNQQPEGLMRYDRVTSLLIAYYKKYQRL